MVSGLKVGAPPGMPVAGQSGKSVFGEKVYGTVCGSRIGAAVTLYGWSMDECLKAVSWPAGTLLPRAPGRADACCLAMRSCAGMRPVAAPTFTNQHQAVASACAAGQADPLQRASLGVPATAGAVRSGQ